MWECEKSRGAIQGNEVWVIYIKRQKGVVLGILQMTFKGQWQSYTITLLTENWNVFISCSFSKVLRIYTEATLINDVKSLWIGIHRMWKCVEDLNKDKQIENFSVILQHILCIVKESAFNDPLSKSSLHAPFKRRNMSFYPIRGSLGNHLNNRRWNEYDNYAKL